MGKTKPAPTRLPITASECGWTTGPGYRLTPDFPQTSTTFGIRTERYKTIRYHGIWDTNEIYDLQSDPHEIQNLIDAPEHQEKIAGLLTSFMSG
jgi:hypothetical protein